MWSYQDIAEFFGVTRKTVYEWRHKYKDFPPPARNVNKRMQRWEPEAIKAWRAAACV